MVFLLEETAAGNLAGLGLASFFGAFALSWVVIVIFILVLLISGMVALLALFDVLTAKNASDWKVLWVVIILFLGIFGAVLYYFLARKERLS